MNVLQETWNEFSNDDCGTLAAALAYYTVFSLPSALLIIIMVAGSVFGRAAVQDQIQARLSGSLGPQVAQEVQTMVRNVSLSHTGGTLALIFGIAGLFFAASNVFLQLQTALNRAWAVKPKESGVSGVLTKRALSFALVVGIGLLVLIALAASALASRFSGALGVPGPLVHAGEVVVSWVIFLFLFGAIYKVLPDARIAWSDVRTGAAVTAVLFVVGKFLIGLYLGHSGTATAYGAAGSLALLLLWTYYSSMVFLFGAEFTRVWARRHGKEIQPDRHAVRVAKEERPAA